MTSPPSLVLLAAGLGTRFGGPKQLAPVGPEGEPLFVLSARQAADAGVERVVVVTRADIVDAVRDATARVDLPAVEFVIQDHVGPRRSVPWGTAHAVAACAPRLDGAFVVANADDHYGVPAIATAVEKARGIDDDTAWIITFPLGTTLSRNGPVARAICEAVGDGNVVGLHEREGLVRVGDHIVDSRGRTYEFRAPASMNLMALPRSAPAMLRASFDRFVASDDHADSEFVLPEALNWLQDRGRISLRCVPTTAAWHGLTHSEDAISVRRDLSPVADRVVH